MGCRGCLGRSTVGCFLLAICCCLVSVTAARGAKPQLPRERDQLVRGRVTALTHKIRANLLRDLAVWLPPGVFLCSLGELARTHIGVLCEWLEEFMITMLTGAQEPESGVGDAECFGATVWMAGILACRAWEFHSHLGAAGARAASPSDGLWWCMPLQLLCCCGNGRGWQWL